MSFFEKDGEVYKQVPAGGHGGGVTSFATVKASADEAASFRASQPRAEGEAEAIEGEPRQDGPTIEEWVKEGYKASAYPPKGYASKSTPEEVAAAVQAEVESDKASA